MEKARIWELDIFRGICIIGVLCAHLYYDLTVFGGLTLPLPPFFTALFQYGGILFVVLSGICVTLGRHSAKRGAIVLFCGLGITAVTLLFSLLIKDDTAVVLFGVLHLLGLCMLSYPLFRRLPTALLLLLGAAFIALGLYFTGIRVSVPYLFPLGLTTKTFYSADYWPIFPNLGYFLLGVAAGRTVYGDKQPKIPALQEKCRFLAFCGRQSLILYLAQQPVCIGLAALLGLVLRLL